MRVCTLSSGSSGNCVLLSGGGVHILVDCGISCKRIGEELKELGLSPTDVSGIFITHEHSDHIGGLATLVKKFALPVYTAPGTALELRRRIAFPLGVLREVEPGERVTLGGLEGVGFPISHDAAQPMGFTFSDGEKRAAVCTDLGYVPPELVEAVAGCGLVVCEANHDVDWLLSGPYPYALKRRILGDKGHLSNEAGAGLALECARRGTGTVVLAHLSAENNTPARAMAAAETAFRGAGMEPGKDVKLAVAPRNGLSPLFEV